MNIFQQVFYDAQAANKKEKARAKSLNSTEVEHLKPPVEIEPIVKKSVAEAEMRRQTIPIKSKVSPPQKIPQKAPPANEIEALREELAEERRKRESLENRFMEFFKEYEKFFDYVEAIEFKVNELELKLQNSEKKVRFN